MLLKVNWMLHKCWHRALTITKHIIHPTVIFRSHEMITFWRESVAFYHCFLQYRENWELLLLFMHNWAGDCSWQECKLQTSLINDDHVRGKIKNSLTVSFHVICYDDCGAFVQSDLKKYHPKCFSSPCQLNKNFYTSASSFKLIRVSLLMETALIKIYNFHAYSIHIS